MDPVTVLRSGPPYDTVDGAWGQSPEHKCQLKRVWESILGALRPLDAERPQHHSTQSVERDRAYESGSSRSAWEPILGALRPLDAERRQHHSTQSVERDRAYESGFLQ
jgi:hypothetical protein